MKSFYSVNRADAQEVIEQCRICTVAMVLPDGDPYAIPMNFVCVGDSIYLHGAAEGIKRESMRLHPRVCVSFTTSGELVCQHESMACSHSMRAGSVLAFGSAHEVDSIEDRRRSFELMMAYYTGRHDFDYSLPSLENVVVWEIRVDRFETKWVGLTYEEYLRRVNRS